MKAALIGSILALVSTQAFAQDEDVMARAHASGHCSQTGVKSATLLPSGALQITCKRLNFFQRIQNNATPAVPGAEATNVVPLVGALAPAALGAGVAGAGILALAGGNSATSDTQ